MNNDKIEYFKCSQCDTNYPISQKKLQNLCINCYNKILNKDGESMNEIKFNINNDSDRVILQG